MKQAVELINLFWTTAGMYPGDGEISRFDFKDRVEAAARAGFKGIGIWHTDLEHILLTRTLPEMKLILDDNGIKYLELEFLTDWFLEGARKAESDNRKRRLFEASAALQAKHVKVGDFYSSACPMPRLVEAFAALCREAEDYGATIAFEFMASAMLNSLKDSLTMVETAGAANGGIVLDIVHVVNLGISYDEIGRMPLPYLVSVELNDGGLPGGPQHDPSGGRLFCGDGEYDLKGFINTIQALGYQGPWAVEVFSRDMAGLSLAELNNRAYSTTIAQFEA
jgi:sugar phosphate isomerase/epimerase